MDERYAASMMRSGRQESPLNTPINIKGIVKCAEMQRWDKKARKKRQKRRRSKKEGKRFFDFYHSIISLRFLERGPNFSMVGLFVIAQRKNEQLICNKLARS